MYLKSIEIQGFKSFANKIKLEFHNGFTAIVGPNGSGKSNVADAVRWVLGEQRVKQLRGGSMQDVIFAGTELRKPLSSAYVAITFDNSDHKLPVDYKEVTVARRLYRSGESEYLLNNVQVRLRDVQELFYDTGIGKEGYSIIGQGQIEKILSDKPEDRRELFDEAAGIVKFKRRKELSVKKLENEKANLIRVNDILTELERQVGPLERQSEKAQIYLKAHEELKNLDVNLFLMQNGETMKQLEDLKEKLGIAGNDLERTQKQYEETRTSYDALGTELETLDQTIEATRGEIARSNVVRNQLETQIKVAEESIRSMTGNAEHFRTREESVRGEIEEKQRERTSIADGKSGIDTQMSELEANRRAAEEELEQVQADEKSLSDAIDEKRSALMETIANRGTIKAKLAAMTTRREQYEVRKSELTSRLVRASSDEAEHDRELERLRAVFEKVAGEAADLGDRQKKLEVQIAEKKTALTAADERLRSTEVEYHQEKSRLDALANLTERYEGFGGSVKKVMEQKVREPGLIGVVADLVKTEPKYETAIETALGGSIQNIVTNDEDTAKRMIGLLKREKAGRATFLPLTAIRSSQGFNMMGALKERGVVGLADTLVRTAPEYRDVARSLLGRILVVDQYDHAVEISRKYQQKIRMVTLEGEMFMPGGAISGGMFRNSSNLLGRRREIAELEKRTKELKASMEKLEEEIASSREERNRLRAEQESVRVQLQAKFIEQNTARMNINAEEERKKESSEGYDALREENETIEETKHDLDREEQEIRKELADSEEAEARGSAEIEELTKKLTGFRDLEDEKQGIVQKWDIEVQKKRQKQEFEEQELSRVDGEISRLTMELNEILESIRQGSVAIEDKKKNIETLKETIESAQDNLQEKQELLTKSQEKKTELSARQKKTLEEREQLAEEKTRLDKEVFRLGELKNKSEEAMERQISYLWDEYELTPSQAAELRDEQMNDLARMRTRAEELKKQIRSLGSVNVNAIQEYQEVKERYTFLKGQHDDLIAAAQSLEKIIEELDVQMRRQFKTQFARIQTEFDKVFKQLFGGGSGRLELMEDADILEAGVRVIAQPPGKKLVNMMQMSGGEKSLTAISLLFAIQNLKPSPFCLLDEIEAALDENNVVRYADYLRKLTDNTQFIVITHRRGTMDRADRLYGITMQEKGVSTLVSVSLIDEKDLAS